MFVYIERLWLHKQNQRWQAAKASSLR